MVSLKSGAASTYEMTDKSYPKMEAPSLYVSAVLQSPHPSKTDSLTGVKSARRLVTHAAKLAQSAV